MSEPYIDFDFYETKYGGNSIQEENFRPFAVSASSYIDAATLRRARSATGTVLAAVKICACALAEVLSEAKGAAQAALGAGQIASESVGGHSVSYAVKTATTADLDYTERRAQKILSIYLGWTGLLSVRAAYAPPPGRRKPP